MARFRASFGRILTLGGLAAASGSVVAYQSLISEKTQARAVLENSADEKEQNPWDANWDRRKLGDLKNKIVSKNITTLKENEDEKPVKTTTNENKEEKTKKEPRASRHLILVRHGQYNHGKTDEDRTLTELGRQQAVNTRERLKSLDIKFDKIVHSTMTRAKETADLIKESFPEVKYDSCSLLREGAPCPPEPGSSSSWNPDKWQEYFQDGSRIEAAFRKYFHRADPNQANDSHELIVCHANVIRYFVCRALQFPPEGWLRMSIANCGMTSITIRPNGRVSLKSLGDAGHLPPDQITFK